MKKHYPFDPSVRHHLLIALGLVIWVFVFLYFTKPLDVTEFGPREQLIYLPLYGLFASLCYLASLPFQYWLFRKQNEKWTLSSELSQLLFLFVLAFVIVRLVYYYIVMEAHPNAYTITYFATHIYIPAILTILPIVAIGRWSFGKYKEKKLEEQKVEVKGTGNYESLRLALNDLVCIQSSDNYVEVTYQEGQELRKQLIRNKLTAVEASLNDLVRTHRSYLINPHHFKQWRTGNRKVNVVLSYDLEVPVSKTYHEAVEKAVNSATES